MEKAQVIYYNRIMLDEELINKILSKKYVVSFVLSDGVDLRILEWIRRHTKP